MGSNGSDRAVGEQGNPIRQQHRRRPMCDNDAGHSSEHPFQCLLDQRLGMDVE